MKVYTINASKEGTTFLPELTASDQTADRRKEYLQAQGYAVVVTEHELKTQGKNWGEIAKPLKANGLTLK